MQARSPATGDETRSSDPAGAPPDAEGRCRRAYFRVATRLSLRVTWLPAEKVDSVELEIQGPRDGQLEIEDPAVARQLRQIEAKIDLLLSKLGHDVARPLGRGDLQEVSISGSGLRMQTRETFRTNDYVQVEVLLPGTPPHPVRAVARIVQVAEGRSARSPSEVAMVFTSISEEDREAVIRHAYEVQRLSLRSRSDQTGAQAHF